MTASANPAATASSLLRVENVTRHFGGLAALDNVSLDIQAGEIYGLIGPNGAGKTTLFNVVTGLYAPDAGHVWLGVHALSGRKPHEVVERGIARTFQNIRLFANMTALENVMVGRHVRTHAGVVGAIVRGGATRAEETGIQHRARDCWTTSASARR